MIALIEKCCSYTQESNTIYRKHSDCFASTPHNPFFSETHFIDEIDRYGHAAYCVKISYKSKHRKSVKNAVCQQQTH